MAFFSVQSANLRGCAVTLGDERHIFDEEPEYYNNDPALLKRLKNQIGFNCRYTAKKGMTTADLCEDAARRLLSVLNLTKDDIGAVLSITQPPDYAMPGNAHLLHDSDLL